jgi:hypothetical protein
MQVYDKLGIVSRHSWGESRRALRPLYRDPLLLEGECGTPWLAPNQPGGRYTSGNHGIRLDLQGE